MNISPIQQKINELNSRIKSVEKEQANLENQKTQYEIAYKNAGGTSEDLDEDPAMVAINFQSTTLNAQLNSLNAQKNLLGEDSSTQNLSAGDKKIQEQINNIKLERLNLSEQAANYACAYAEFGGTGSLSDDNFMLSLTFKDRELEMEQYNLEAQLNKNKENPLYGTINKYKLEISDINRRLTEIESQIVQLEATSREYESAYLKNNQNLDNDPTMLAIKFQLSQIEAEKSALLAQKTDLTGKLEENNSLPQEGSNASEINNIQYQINELYAEQEDLIKKMNSYVPAYTDTGLSDLENDSYFVSLKYKLETVESNINTLKEHQTQLLLQNENYNTYTQTNLKKRNIANIDAFTTPNNEAFTNAKNAFNMFSSIIQTIK